ncbi:MAG: ThuA domain-containing protein [Dehalococcoidia bacterium]|nr:ThuA domain-containing protein [Dehalococcoidia bacterium]
MSVKVLVVTKGHPFDYNGFYAMFDENPELLTTQVEQPAAQVMLRPENVAEYEAVCFYDMWGTESPDGGASFVPAPDEYQQSIAALLESGKGIVMMNHAIVQWPAWPGWRDVSGTSFLLTEGEVFGEMTPGSGYRGGAVDPRGNPTGTVSADPGAAGHPVLEGVEPFTIEDELYLTSKRFESQPDILPLMRTDYPMVKENFNPPPLAPADEQAGWDHPEGSNLVVWAKKSVNSPVIAMQIGDGPNCYANPGFRKLLSNALHWVATEDARAWAAS